MSIQQLGPKTYLSRMSALYQIPNTVINSTQGYISQTLDEKIIFVNYGGGTYPIYTFDPYTGTTAQNSVSMMSTWQGTGLDLLSTLSTKGNIGFTTSSQIATNIANKTTTLSVNGFLYSGKAAGAGKSKPVLVPFNSTSLPDSQSVISPSAYTEFTGTAINTGYNYKFNFVKDQVLDYTSDIFFSSPTWPSNSDVFPPTIAFSLDNPGFFSINYSFLYSQNQNQYCASVNTSGLPFPMSGKGSLNTRSKTFTTIRDTSFINFYKTSFPGFTWNIDYTASQGVTNSYKNNPAHYVQGSAEATYMPTVNTSTGIWSLPNFNPNYNAAYPCWLYDYPGYNCHIVGGYDVLNNQNFPTDLRNHLVGVSTNNETIPFNYGNNIETTPYYKFNGYAVVMSPGYASFSLFLNHTYNYSLQCTPQNILIGDFYVEKVFLNTTLCIPTVYYENGFKLYLDVPQKSPAGYSFQSSDADIQTNGIKWLHIRKDGLIGAIVVDIAQNLWYCVSDPPYFKSFSALQNFIKVV